MLAALLALPMPKYWSVHIDTPRRDARATFEQVDVDNATAIRGFHAARGEEPPPSWIFSTSSPDHPISVKKTGLAETRDVEARARPDLR